MSRYRSHSDTSLTLMQHALDEQGIAYHLVKHDIVSSDPDASDIATDLGLTLVKEPKNDRR